MRQFTAIAINAFMDLVRQPVYLLLLTVSSGFCVFLAAVPYFGFGDDPKLVKDMTLAVMLLSGLLCSVLCASASVAQEIRSGTVLTVLAKPVGRIQFLLAKYAGLAATLALLTVANGIAALLASRMAFDAYGEADTQSLIAYFGAALLAYGAAGFMNFFLSRPFAPNAVFFFVVLTLGAFLYILYFTKLEKGFGELAMVDWRLIRAGILILFALWVLAALALACSTRLDVIPTLAICSVFFLVGLTSDYFFGRGAKDGALWAQFCYTITPNWQLFWMSDALEGKKDIPWDYVGRAAGYLVAYVSAALSIALLLFEDRELS
jgi:ABC-type transport system involved in multi-copper enzyme maturation permease subunit